MHDLLSVGTLVEFKMHDSGPGGLMDWFVELVDTNKRGVIVGNTNNSYTVKPLEDTVAICTTTFTTAYDTVKPIKTFKKF